MLMRVLIVARRNDAHAAAVAARLEAQAVPHLLLVLEDIDGVHIRWQSPKRLAFVVRGTVWRVAPATTVWWRRPAPPRMQHGSEDERALYRDEAAAILMGALLAAGPRWIDHPAAQWVAGHKLLQLRTAAALGIRVPETIATNDPEDGQRWADQIGAPVLAKAVSSGPGIAPFADQVSADDLELLVHCPTLLQSVVSAEADIRVVTFGDTAFAWARARRPGEPIDWRRVDPAGAAFRQVTEPEVCRSALALANALDLRFSVQDWLIGGQADPPVFLEVNPQGNWLFLPGAEDLIAPVLAQYLDMSPTKSTKGVWPGWKTRLLRDLLPEKWPPSADGLKGPSYQRPRWLAPGSPVTEDMVDFVRERKSEAEARAGHAEVRCGKIGTLAMTLLTLAFAVTVFSATRLQDRGALISWQALLLLPGLCAVTALSLAALQGLTGDHSVRLADGSEPEGLFSGSLDERHRATAEAHHRAAFIADWSADKKLSEALQARAWLTRGIVALLLAGVVGAFAFVVPSPPPTDSPGVQTGPDPAASP
jgi:glutathione synthase/RimK-type ligase-like ATP-grasp enzyme